MNKHKIIMSMYYSNPYTKASSIKEAEYNIGIDMTQLLLLMEGVFDEKEYKYCNDRKRLRIEPREDKKDKYSCLIDDSDKELKQAEILIAPVELPETPDYQQIDSFGAQLPKAKDYLYFFNVLINDVNGRSMLQTRESFVYYRLFNIRDGKDYVCFLITMVLRLLTAYSEGGCEGAKEIVETLDEDYIKMRYVYNNRYNVMENMRDREEDFQNMYPVHIFVNQSQVFRDWLEERQNITKETNIFEFIFYQNHAMKQYALNFLNHIIQIARTLLDDEKSLGNWEKIINQTGRRTRRDFYHLDKLLSQLKDKKGDKSFDMNQWTYQYMQRLEALTKTLPIV